MSDPFNISGRAYVVTGGAGHLGRYICAGLSNARAQVLCLSSNMTTFSDLLLPCAGRIESVVCDVSNEDQFEEMISKFRERSGLDGLVNNAMRAPRGIDLNMPRSEFSMALDTILTQYFTCARVAIRNMGGGGSIVNVASMWGLVSPDPAMYPEDMRNEPCLAMPPAAAGILAMTRYLSVLAAASDIRVNSLVPGCFPKKRGPDRPDYMAEMQKRIPMGRVGRAAELVGPTIFLLSGASSYVTGQSLIVDGGYTAR